LIYSSAVRIKDFESLDLGSIPSRSIRRTIMKGRRISIMVGDTWFESIKDAEIALGLHSLRENYNRAIKKGITPKYKGMNIYYNAPKPITREERIRAEHVFGEPLIKTPITSWLGGH
jgi:hypothetical protein